MTHSSGHNHPGGTTERSSLDVASATNCERCGELEKLLRRGEEALAEEGQRRIAAEHQARRSGMAEVAIRNELAKVREEEPESDDIREVLGLWRDDVKGGDKRFKTDASGPRAKRVKWALKKYGKERVASAILGCTLDDWAMGRIRKTGGRQFNDVASHILKDEETVERFEGLWLARNDPKPAPAAPSAPTSTGPPATVRLIERLDGVRETGPGRWLARCPAHDDRHASLTVAQGHKGAVATCHAGCSTHDIAKALDVPLAEWFDPEPPPLPANTPRALPTLEQLGRWRTALFRHAKLLRRLHELKGWTGEALYELGIGWDGKRLVFPVHGPDGQLLTVTRYLPNGEPKMQAIPGRQRGLFPAPEFVAPGDLWLVEGEPDAVTGYRLGLPTVGVPGVNSWRPEWAQRFTDRHVVVCFDCDDPGRKAADKIANAIVPHASEVRLVDLGGADGFDLTDFALAGGTVEQLAFLAASATPITGLRNVA